MATRAQAAGGAGGCPWWCRVKACLRHCWVWAVVGDWTVIACGHCDRVQKDWLTVEGDLGRVQDSQLAHGRLCGRRVEWLAA